jgi:hypothetical protein
MAKYKCGSCGAEKDIQNKTIKIIGGVARVVESLCACGEYMESQEEFKGYPGLIRTEPSLKK